MSASSSWRELGSAPRKLLVASALNNFGTGLVLPLLVAFVTLVSGLDVRVATTCVAVTSVGAAAGGPFFGWLADRIGRRTTITTSLLISTCGTLLYSIATTPASFFAAAGMLGLGLGGNSAWFTVLAESVEARLRPDVFGLNLLVTNAAIGLGGLVSGLVVRDVSASSFRILYIANALTFLIALVLIRSVLTKHSATRPVSGEPAGDSPERGPSYLDLLRDRRLAPLLGLVAAAFAVGYSQLEGGIPAALVGGRHISPAQMAIAFGVNTVAVIGVQLLLQGRFARLAARRAAVGMTLCWAVTWALVLAAVEAPPGVAALVWLSVGFVVFAIGECLYGVTVPTLVNSVVDDEGRGRANGLYSVMMSIGFFVGPLTAGQLLVKTSAEVMAITMGIGCMVAALLAWRTISAKRTADLAGYR